MPPRAIKLLNVDDTEVARYTKTRTLQHAGFDVVEAVDAAEALRMMAEHEPQLAILDVQLPDLDGIGLCRLIKSRWPSTLVLQTSAHFVTAWDRTRGLEGGADGYLSQPIEPAELVASVRALLRLHSAEASMRELNESLERRIEERTRDLHEANAALIEQIAQRERAEASLVQAQKMEAVGQLTSSMAHDFNNILASMVGYIHLVRRRHADADAAALLDKALAAAGRGRRLTSRLLTFSRGDPPVLAVVDLRRLLTDIGEWLQQSAGSTIRLEVDAGEVPMLALTDAQQAELALLNLVINARDAMPGGGVVRLSLHRAVVESLSTQPAPGAYIVVTVRDNGVGMPPEVAQRAFDPFFTTKPAGRGTGLGLAQVMSVARLSQGTATIDSRPGAGTRIELWLRASGDAPQPGQRPAADAAAVLRGAHVLLVDDEVDILQTAAPLLGDAGCEVRCAASGREAVQAVDDGVPVDILVVDFALQDLTGIEVARRVRERRSGLPVLFISGHATYALVSSAVEGSRLVRKPFRIDELIAEMASLLEAREGA